MMHANAGIARVVYGPKPPPVPAGPRKKAAKKYRILGKKNRQVILD